MIFDPAPLVDAACDVLRELGPLQVIALAEHLDPKLFGGECPDHERAEALDGYLMDSDRVVELPDGRLGDMDTLTWGLTLTHRLTQRELDLEGVDIEPDLGPLCFDRDGFDLAGGGRANVAYPEDLEGDDGYEGVPVNGSLFGPPGWLSAFRAGDLVAFRRRGSELDVSTADPSAERSEDASEALRAAWRAWRDDGPMVFSFACVLAVLDASPELFRSPLAPLSDLSDAAGLEIEVDRLVDPEDRSEQVSNMLADRYGFAECCTEALMACVGVLTLTQKGVDPPAHLCREIAEQLAHGGVASALCDVLLTAGTVETDDLERFMHTLRPHARRRERAALAFVGSVLADLAGDAARAEQLCVSALSDDPEYAPALLALAGFAEDRGDAARAISFRNRLDPTDPRIERLRPFAEPPHHAGRNQPCPCGSGRKYKVCCARKVGASLAQRAPWLYERAVMWALGPTRLGLVRALARERAGGDPAAANETPDLTVVEFALFEEGRLAGYLDARAGVLPPDEFARGHGWLGTPRAVWEVASVRPGEGLELLDMSSGDTEWVGDRAASRTLHPGDWLWARVVSDGEGAILVGGPTIVPMRARQSLLALMDAEPDGFDMAAWLGEAETMRMATFEGEPLVLCTARYSVPDLPAAATELAERLEAGADGGFVDTVDIGGDPIARGFIRLDDGVATVTTNAEARFARLRALLLEAAPGAVLLDEERTDPAEAMRGGQARGEPAAGSSLDDLPPEARADLERALKEQVARWEERWVDEPIPALGGATPRQALDDPTRRGELMTLLREMERRLPPAGMARGMDTDRLRALLGLQG